MSFGRAATFEADKLVEGGLGANDVDDTEPHIHLTYDCIQACGSWLKKKTIDYVDQHPTQLLAPFVLG